MPNLPKINLKDTFVVGLPKNSISRKEIDDYLTNDLNRMKEEVYRRKMIVANQWDAETTEPQDMSQTLEASLANVQNQLEKLNAVLSLDLNNTEDILASYNPNGILYNNELKTGQVIGLYNSTIRAVKNGTYDQASQTVLLNELQNLDPLLSGICLNLSNIASLIMDIDDKDLKSNMALVKTLTNLSIYTLLHDNIKSQKLKIITYPMIREYMPILVKREIRTDKGRKFVLNAFNNIPHVEERMLNSTVVQRIEGIEAERGQPLSQSEKDKIYAMYSTKNPFVPLIDKSVMDQLNGVQGDDGTESDIEVSTETESDAGRERLWDHVQDEGLEEEPQRRRSPPRATPQPQREQNPQRRRSPPQRRRVPINDADEDDINRQFEGYGKKKRAPKKTSKTHFNVPNEAIVHQEVPFDTHPFY